MSELVPWLYKLCMHQKVHLESAKAIHDGIVLFIASNKATGCLYFYAFYQQCLFNFPYTNIGNGR